MFSIVNLKLEKFKQLREERVKTICIIEESIEGRQHAISTYPKDADRIKRVEGDNAAIEEFKEMIQKEEFHVDNLNRLIEKYEKLSKGVK